MTSDKKLRRQLIESDGFEALEMLRAFDNSYHAFKYHHQQLMTAITSGDQSQYQLSRLFIAYSGSIFPLRDQAEQLCSRMIPKKQKEYRNKLCEGIELQVSDFLIELRNYVQHTHIPFLLSTENISSRYGVQDKVVPEGVYIHIDELRERGRDFRKSRAIDFLENHEGDLIELEPLLTQYFNDCLEFNSWVATTYRQEKQRSIDEAEELLEQLL